MADAMLKPELRQSAMDLMNLHARRTAAQPSLSSSSSSSSLPPSMDAVGGGGGGQRDGGGGLSWQIADE